MTRGVALAVAVGAAALAALLGFGVVRGWAPLLDADLRIDSAIHDWALTAPWAVALARFLAIIGATLWCTILATSVVVVLLVAGRWRTALTVALAAIVSTLITHNLKPAVARARPTWPEPFETLTDASFPSGHATAGIAVWVVCGLALGSLVRERRWRVGVVTAFTVIGVAIGISRMVLGVHWPSDVLAGWCIGTAVACAVSAALVIPAARADVRRADPGS